MSKIPETEPVVSLKVAQAREANIIKTMGAEAASKLQVMAAQNRELAELLKEARDELDLLKAGQQGALSPNEEPEGKKVKIRFNYAIIFFPFFLFSCYSFLDC